MSAIRNKFSRDELGLINRRATELSRAAWAMCQEQVMAEALRLKLAGRPLLSEADLAGIDVAFACDVAEKPF